MYPPGLHISNRFQALNDEDEPNLCPVEKQWTGGKITVDSGAAESVWPAGFMPEIQIKPSVGSQTGVIYIAANGNRMPNLGEKKVHFKTKDGLNSSITFQVTKVKKPLAAVSKITEKGNWVCSGPSEAYIENVPTGKRTNLELHNGTHSLEVRNSTKPSKPESVSPCGAERCVDDVSDSEDVDHSAQPSASCGTDGEKGGESGVRSPKKVQDPRVPTQAEVDEHNMTHLPYLSWCTHCVRGRGEAHPHHESGDEERDVPELHMDYCFMGKVDETAQPILVMKERDTRMMCSMLVGEKGAVDEHVI